GPTKESSEQIASNCCSSHRDILDRSGNQTRYIPQNATGKHPHNDRERNPSHYPSTNTQHSHQKHQQSADEIRTDDLRKAKTVGERSKIDKNRNRQRDRNRRG